ncbi:hypothetical protein LXL04_031210 [Taraxacum kok-saghyz]
MFVIIGDKSRDHSWLNVSSQASSVPPFAPPNHRLPEGSATPMASDLAAKAKEAYIDDHFELAIELYSQGILIDPNNSELFSDRAQANIKLKNFTGMSLLVCDPITKCPWFIKNLMDQAGLSVREDAVGNIFGRWEGSEPSLPAVSTGSHIDAIPYSGKYDGVVGVLGAIESINVLKSRLLAGSESLARSLKQTVVDNDNISFLDAAKSAGYAKTEDFSNVFLDERSYSAFVELHIEQGPILENEGISIGIVTAIAAPASIKVDFGGNGGHAGTVLMPQSSNRHSWIRCNKELEEMERVETTEADVQVVENGDVEMSKFKDGNHMFYYGSVTTEFATESFLRILQRKDSYGFYNGSVPTDFATEYIGYGIKSVATLQRK